jgi:hypothetical protein
MKYIINGTKLNKNLIKFYEFLLLKIIKAVCIDKKIKIK